MALSNGTKLGPYEVLSAAGAGGMGEVYRARDTRLDRTVAIKVLPSHLSSNAELKSRFEREARAISSLQHPHICTLHDIGSQDGVDFLVMEYLEGQTLADRLTKGPLPIGQALKTATELAEALDKAHKQGIIHRDLKPGNIMLTKSGAKLMDFGLAKPTIAVGVAAGAPVTPATPTMSVASLTAQVSAVTQKGTVVGTFQYIAPEVLQGAEADARSDIFGFGCVLYEMVTGRRAFDGKSQLSVMTAILEKDPEPVQAVMPTAPRGLDRLISGCLVKDPAERIQSAHDVALQLQWLSESAEKEEKQTRSASPIGWIAASVLLLAMAIGAIVVSRSWPEQPVLQTSITTPDGMTLETVGDSAAPATISPDGTMVVLRAATKAIPAAALWVRHLDTGNWQRLDGTDNATFPFWSPDSKMVGFFTTDAKMCRVGLNGGAITQIATAPLGKGGSWGKDGTILYAPNFQSGLYRVSADGGTPVEVTKLDRPMHTTHRWPVLLPDGKHFLYFAASHSGTVSPEGNGIYFASLDGKVNRKLMTNEGNATFADGYLLYRSGVSLQARRFDPSSGEFKGEAIQVNDDVQYDSSVWHTAVTVSDTGMLVVEQGGQLAGTQLEWFDRSGKSQPLTNAARSDLNSFVNLRISPDGRRVAVSNAATLADIWVIDTSRGTPARLTFGQFNHFSPAWSPDGKRIAYGQGSSAGLTPAFSFGIAIHIRNADGSGTDEEVMAGDPAVSSSLMDWTKDGKYLVFSRGTGPTYASLWALPLFGDRKAFELVKPPTSTGSISQGAVSYDSKWLAYTSDESGRPEIYITSFPTANGKVQASLEGALHPVWRRDGKELYFVSTKDSMLMAVDIKNGRDGVEVGRPHPLFSLVSSSHLWDASPDGQRFMMTTVPKGEAKPMKLIANWTALVKKK